MWGDGVFRRGVCTAFSFVLEDGRFLAWMRRQRAISAKLDTSMVGREVGGRLLVNYLS